MEALKRILTADSGSDNEEAESKKADVRPGHIHEIEDWDQHAQEMYLCKLCGQLYVSFDLFYDHRESSNADGTTIEGDDDDDYRKLEPTDEIPDDAVIGDLVPCSGATTGKNND